jgi:hypothetical protein
MYSTLDVRAVANVFVSLSMDSLDSLLSAWKASMMNGALRTWCKMRSIISFIFLNPLAPEDF